MALVFLSVVVVLMLLGTMGVMSFGDQMLKATGVETQAMQPRGEDLNK